MSPNCAQNLTSHRSVNDSPQRKAQITEDETRMTLIACVPVKRTYAFGV